MSIEARSAGHWTIAEIPYGAIDHRRARADPCLVYLVAGASLHARIGEADQEDVYCAIKHVLQVLHPDRPFTSADYRQVQDHYPRLIRRHYPYRTAVQMLLRPLDLSPLLQSAVAPLLGIGARAGLSAIGRANRT